MNTSLEECSDDAQWDKLVDSASHGTIFHKYRFLKMMEKYSGSRLHPMIFKRGGVPEGLYPIFSGRTHGIKMAFSPPPHCSVPYLGPLILNYDSLTTAKKERVYLELQEEADRFINRELGIGYVTLATPPGLIDSRPLTWAGYSVRPLYDYVLDLSLSEEQLWKQLGRKLRKQINKEKTGEVSIEEGGREDIRSIYKLLCTRYKEQGRSVSVPLNYLMEIFDEFYPNNMKILVARYRGECVGGLIDLYYREKASSWVGNPKPKIGTSVNEMLQYKAVTRAKESGCFVYEEMGANTEHLCRYKSKFNPNLSMHYNARRCGPIISVAEKAYSSLYKPLRERILSLKNPEEDLKTK